MAHRVAVGALVATGMPERRSRLLDMKKYAVLVAVLVVAPPEPSQGTLFAG